jgi:exosortase family protein XrtG
MRLAAVLTLVAFPIWVFILARLWKARRWLPFYLLGALGFVIFLTLGASFTGLDGLLESAEAAQVLALAKQVGLTLVVLGRNGLAIRNHTGWGVFDIGVECSGLLEMAAMAGLILFYPAVYTPARKAFIVVVGTAATYLFNILRVLLIVAIVNSMGADWVFPAHAVFGRFFFFLATIALYWWLVTRPTVRHVGQELTDPEDPERPNAEEPATEAVFTPLVLEPAMETVLEPADIDPGDPGAAARDE